MWKKALHFGELSEKRIDYFTLLHTNAFHPKQYDDDG
jgi:hypothetical protein